MTKLLLLGVLGVLAVQQVWANAPMPRLRPVQLDWQNPPAAARSFEIERAASAGGPWQRIARLPAPVRSYRDPFAQRDRSYWYRIGAQVKGKTIYSEVCSCKT